MSQTTAPERPGTVTTVMVLTYLAGFFDIVGAVVLFAVAGNSSLRDATGQSTGTLTTMAVVSIVLGLVTIGVGTLLGRGAPIARILVTVLMTLRIVAALATMALIGLAAAGEALIGLVLAVVVIAFLWTRRATEFFSAAR
jgi:low temperature requirement protein LtrA